MHLHYSFILVHQAIEIYLHKRLKIDPLIDVIFYKYCPNTKKTLFSFIWKIEVLAIYSKVRRPAPLSNTDLQASKITKLKT